MIDERYNLTSCLYSVKQQIENFGEDPIRLLGKYILRAEQDPLFNTTMVTAIKQYIKDNNIEWDYKQER